MSILVRRQQEKYLFGMKTAVNYDTVKHQVGAQRKGLIKGSFLLQYCLDKIKINYRLMSILVRRQQEKYFFGLKTAVNYDTVKHQVGAEVSRFEVPSSEGFFSLEVTVDI